MATDKSIPKAAKFVLGGSAGVSQTSLAVVAIATSAGCSGTAFGRHMDKASFPLSPSLTSPLHSEHILESSGDELRLAAFQAIHVAIDTYHFYVPYLFYRWFILIHFELAKSRDTLIDGPLFCCS
ncbi:hypothetical protein Y032_0204g1883 [Ancylostoma ceylanicum]|uniref:Uncharacterized protein n=1 Tax=Ancylostoma ceylanicum TaxID=53326 RepID=A0A016SMM3_9BILA|nr:hypothetical protein Y032_0204g1883 [Ancylostoma ceylanicum]